MNHDPILFPMRSLRTAQIRHRTSPQTRRTAGQIKRSRRAARHLTPHDAVLWRAVRTMRKDELRACEEHARLGWIIRRAALLEARRELVDQHRLEWFTRVLREVASAAELFCAAVERAARRPEP